MPACMQQPEHASFPSLQGFSFLHQPQPSVLIGVHFLPSVASKSRIDCAIVNLHESNTASPPPIIFWRFHDCLPQGAKNCSSFTIVLPLEVKTRTFNTNGLSINSINYLRKKGWSDQNTPHSDNICFCGCPESPIVENEEE